LKHADHPPLSHPPYSSVARLLRTLLSAGDDPIACYNGGAWDEAAGPARHAVGTLTLAFAGHPWKRDGAVIELKDCQGADPAAPVTGDGRAAIPA